MSKKQYPITKYHTLGGGSIRVLSVDHEKALGAQWTDSPRPEPEPIEIPQIQQEEIKIPGTGQKESSVCADMKALDLISSAMRLIGAIASGEVPTNDEASDALMVLNQMIDSWTADRLMVFTITIDEFSLVVGQQTYTYGTGGNFNAPRPARVDRYSIVSLTNPSQPLELPLDVYTDWDWQQQPVKLINTTLPTAVYDDGAFPFRNLNYWPIPTQPVKTRLYGWTALTQFANLSTTDYTFPPGYIEALRYNLALRLIAEMPGEYNQIMVSTTLALATESMARVKSMNVPIIEAFCDAAISGKGAHYNYYSDTAVGGRNR